MAQIIAPRRVASYGRWASVLRSRVRHGLRSRPSIGPLLKPTRSRTDSGVGVGTGLSLSDYSRATKLCCVAYSEPMRRGTKAGLRCSDLAMSRRSR